MNPQFPRTPGREFLREVRDNPTQPTLPVFDEEKRESKFNRVMERAMPFVMLLFFPLVFFGVWFFWSMVVDLMAWFYHHILPVAAWLAGLLVMGGALNTFRKK
jgi:hypothetical protein